MSQFQEIDMSQELWLIFEEEHQAFVQQKIKEFLEGFLTEDRIAFRQNYLENQISEIENEIIKFKSDYKNSIEEDEPYIDRAVLAAAVEEREKTKRKLKSELKRIMEIDKNNKSDFSEKIERAKQRKFFEFIELRRGRALCPIHNDRKNPSFSVKNERGHCFACGFSGDIIEFIMKLHGFDFKQAVNFLS